MLNIARAQPREVIIYAMANSSYGFGLTFANESRPRTIWDVYRPRLRAIVPFADLIRVSVML